MERISRSLFRCIYGIEALGVLYALGMDLYTEHRAGDMHVPFGLGIYAIGALAFLLFAAAFWTTRSPRPRRNYAATAASLLNLVICIGFLCVAYPYTSTYDRSALPVTALLIALSLVGIILFLQIEKLPDQALPPAKLADIPGDRTWSGTSSIVTLLFVVAAFVLEHSWRQWAAAHGMSRPGPLPMLLYIALALTVTAIIHESGHALSGAMFGMRLLALTIGPFRWARRDGQWKFKLSRQLFGGSVSSAPTHPDQPAWQDAAMIFAGPLANLCSALLLFRIAFASPGTSLARLWFFLSFLASLSLIVPVLNLIPFRTATGNYSDGARLLQLFTGSPIIEYHRALRALKSTLVTTRRARDLDAAVFQRAAALRPAEYLGLHAHVCAAQIFESQGHIPEAAAEIAAAQAIDRGYAVKTPALLYCVFVFFEAVHNRSAAAARLWWDRMDARTPDRTAADYLVAAAALAWIEGRPELEPQGQSRTVDLSADLPAVRAATESAFDRASAAAQRLPNRGAYNATRDRLALLRALPDAPSPLHSEITISIK